MLHQVLENSLRQAVAAVLPDADVAGVLVRPCPDPRFGDYQSNALIALARQRRMNPRELAAAVLEKLDARQWCESVETAGAAFINFRIKPEAFAAVLEGAARGEHLFFQKSAAPRTVVIDFSSPNVAKPMHVGHIRSTILGDSLARVLRLLGHHVITDNHIGDWGTQFGKLLVGWKEHLDRPALEREPIAEMERLYRLANAACEQDPALLDRARQELVRLQNGDPENLAVWREMIALSQKEFDAIYARLGVKFDHALGESFYNPRLRDAVDQLQTCGIVRESDGALVAFFDDDPELKNHPALVLKSDGAANYTTTDLATLAYRFETWRPDEVIYVTDARQQLHFRQLFAIFRRWHPKAQTRLAHVCFGSILGPDGRPFKTRAGETVKLADLLDEAEERAYQVVREKNPDLAETERREIARIVGIGAVKYADLLPNRQSDYVFDWDRMLALNGNTAPYLQYACTRIRSIFRKAEKETGALTGRPVMPRAPEELALARHLVSFGLTLELTASDYRPNFLCNYLYELAGHFARFYETCPVLRAEEPERVSRLVLCDLSARVLRQGLDALGIETTDRM